MTELTKVISAPYPVESLHVIPGIWIKNHANTPRSGEMLVSHFINKTIPKARELVHGLEHLGHISTDHLALKVNTVFFIHIEELVQTYLVQQEDVSTTFELKWKEMQALLAHQRYDKTFGQEKFNTFLNEIAAHLKRYSPVGEDSAPALTLWKELMSLPHIPDLSLIAILDPISTRKYEGARSIRLPLPSLKHAAKLVSHYLLTTWQWTNVQIEQALFPGEERYSPDKKTRKGYKIAQERLTGSNGVFSLKDWQEKFTEIQRLVREATPLFKDIDTMHTPQGTYSTLFEKACCLFDKKDDCICHLPVLSQEINPRILRGTSPGYIQSIMNFYSNLQEAHYLFDAYYAGFLLELLLTLNGIIDAHKESAEKKAEYISVPTLTPSTQPTHRLPAESPVPAAIPHRKKRGSKSKKKKRSQVKRPQESNSNEKKKAPHLAAVRAPSAAIPASAPLPLLDRLYSNQDSSNTYLRQAIWHLDNLQVLCSTAPLDTQEKRFTTYTAVLSSAHKLLEQLYNYRIQKQGGTPLAVHNLRTYHQTLFPDFQAFPPAVQELSLANHWVRYLYRQYNSWHYSFSTRRAVAPQALEDLNALAATEQEKGVSETETLDKIEQVRQLAMSHAEELLQMPNIVTRAPPKPERVQFSEIDFAPLSAHKPRLEQMAREISCNAPHYFPIKQADLSLRMLLTSLGELNKADTTTKLATWTPWALAQTQELIENLLRAIGAKKEIGLPDSHDIRGLANALDIPLSENLAAALQQLSLKVRYPVQYNDIEGGSAEIIDEMELFRQHPEVLSNFALIGRSSLIWKTPEGVPNINETLSKLQTLLNGIAVLLDQHLMPQVDQ